MTAQTSLFDAPARKPHAPYQRSSETSKAAADKIVSKSEQQREVVFASIDARPNVTRKELESITGFLTQSLCARLNELEGDPRKNLPRRIRKVTRLAGKPGAQKVELVKREGCAAYESLRRHS